MSNNYRCWCLLGLMLSAVGVQAGEAGWSAKTSVVALEPTSQARYQMTVAQTEAHSCKSKHGYFQDYSASGARFIYETLLTAMAHNLPVQIHTSGRCDLHGLAEITAVRLAR